MNPFNSFRKSLSLLYRLQLACSHVNGFKGTWFIRCYLAPVSGFICKSFVNFIVLVRMFVLFASLRQIVQIDSTFSGLTTRFSVLTICYFCSIASNA